jgi:acyl dehydratase
MAVDEDLLDLKGRVTGRWRVHVDRGPVDFFARAVTDDNPVYHSREAARAAGFSAIPAPPTFAFIMNHMGSFADDQPDQEGVDGADAHVRFAGGLMQRYPRGLILHGEQEFTYHRPVLVGDVLVGEGRVVDVYERESKGSIMTFLVAENAYSDEATGEPVVTSRMNLIHRRKAE